MRPSIELVEYARSYARLGFYVLPIKPGDKTPVISRWQDKSSKDLTCIEHWWSKEPNSNIGIHAGKSGLVIIDVDPRNGGLKSFARLKNELQNCGCLSTYQVESGGGGLHLYYAAKNLNLLRNLDLGSGIDLIYGNKYVIAPPSVHPSGGIYEWKK